MRKKSILTCLLTSLSLAVCAQSWPTSTTEAKPGTRWWWLGSAVDKENLQWSLDEFEKKGIGAVEITPLYGVQGNQQNNIDFLSDKWFEMLRFVEEQGKQKGIEVGMATGTGWPFGGPWVPLKESACRVVFVEKTFEGTEVKNLDITPSEKEAKNAFLDKVMLYAEGKAYDVTGNIKDGKLTWKPLHSHLAQYTVKRVAAVYIKYG